MPLGVSFRSRQLSPLGWLSPAPHGDAHEHVSRLLCDRTRRDAYYIIFRSLNSRWVAVDISRLEYVSIS